VFGTTNLRYFACPDREYCDHRLYRWPSTSTLCHGCMISSTLYSFAGWFCPSKGPTRESSQKPRNQASMSTAPGRFVPSRTVIPRAQPQRGGPSPPRPPSRPGSAITKPRTSHACDRCRIMRTKCSGGERCTKCIKDNATCVFGDRKRERNRKDLAESLERIGELQNENQILLTALRSLGSRDDFDSSRHSDVLDILSKVLDTSFTRKL